MSCLDRQAVRILSILALVALYWQVAAPQLAQADTPPKDMITFLVRSGDETSTLYAMDTNAQNIRKLVGGLMDEAGYAISTDGQYLLYYDQSLQVRLTTLATGKFSVLVQNDQNSGSVADLALSPDNTDITIGDKVDTVDNHVVVHIERLNVASGARTPLFTYSSHLADHSDQGISFVDEIHWQGDHIFYNFHNNVETATKKSYSNEIHDLSLTDGSDKIIYKTNSTDNFFDVNWLKLSPDHTKVLRAANVLGQAVLLNLKGAQQAVIKESINGLQVSGNDGEYAWAPDGKSIFTVGVSVQYYPTTPKNGKEDLNRYVVRTYNLTTKKFTDVIGRGDTGKATVCGFSTSCFGDMRWYSFTAPTP